MENSEVLSVRRYKVGYEIRKEQCTFGDGEVVVLKSAYTVPEGYYIGSSRWAHRLMVKYGIKPEPREPARPEANGGRGRTCSIGFCERDQTWAGWSHRAMYRFGIGSTCKRGDVHYMADTFAEIAADCFLLRDGVCTAGETFDLTPVSPDDPEGTQVEVPGSRRGACECNELNCIFNPGRGEWVAKTLDDARQMACDFAEGVS